MRTLPVRTALWLMGAMLAAAHALCVTSHHAMHAVNQVDRWLAPPERAGHGSL